jgi:L-asparagine transporter-like permease
MEVQIRIAKDPLARLYRWSRWCTTVGLAFNLVAMVGIATDTRWLLWAYVPFGFFLWAGWEFLDRAGILVRTRMDAAMADFEREYQRLKDAANEAP